MLRRSSHSVWDCVYHVVWATNRRRRALSGRCGSTQDEEHERPAYVKKFPDLKRTMWTTELWSPSYFVRTVGDRVTADAVRRYIESHDDEAALGVQAELFPSGKAKRRT